MIAILFRQLEDDGVDLPQKASLDFYYWINFAVIPTYALSALWIKPHLIIYVISFVSALIQIIAFIRFYPFIKKAFAKWKPKLSKIVTQLYRLAFMIFGVKLIIQLLSATPLIANIGYKLKNYFVIGYLHLIFLGMFSLFFIGWHIHNKGYQVNKMAKNGLYLFMIGILLTEIVLFGNGFLTWARLDLIPEYSNLMFYFSLFMPIGLILFFIGQYKTKA